MIRECKRLKRKHRRCQSGFPPILTWLWRCYKNAGCNLDSRSRPMRWLDCWQVIGASAEVQDPKNVLRILVGIWKGSKRYESQYMDTYELESKFEVVIFHGVRNRCNMIEAQTPLILLTPTPKFTLHHAFWLTNPRRGVYRRLALNSVMELVDDVILILDACNASTTDPTI